MFSESKSKLKHYKLEQTFNSRLARFPHVTGTLDSISTFPSTMTQDACVNYSEVFLSRSSVLLQLIDFPCSVIILSGNILFESEFNTKYPGAEFYLNQLL